MLIIHFNSNVFITIKKISEADQLYKKMIYLVLSSGGPKWKK